MVAVEVHGDVLEGFKGADDSFDADPGGLLEVAGYGQGGHHHRQVGPGGIAGVVEDGAGWQVVLAHRRMTARACHSSWLEETTSPASIRRVGMLVT